MKANADKKNQAGEKSASDRDKSVAELRESNYGLEFPRAVGNQGLRRLFGAKVKSLGPLARGPVTGRIVPVRADISNGPLTLQAKLAVSIPADSFEQEADRVAEQVTSMSEPQVQRKCTCAGSECSKCQKGQTHSAQLQTKSASTPAARRSEAPPIVHEVLNSSGQPLDTTSRRLMESRFGHDFSRVRIHDDVLAAESARSVNALAYTVGENIVFGEGHYDPQSPSGKRLLAHELAHVVQQAGANKSADLQRAPDKPEPKQPAKRRDVVIVGQNWKGAEELGRTVSSGALIIKVTSVGDVVTELAKINFPIGTLYIVTHSAPSGALQFGPAEGTIKPADIAGKLKGSISADNAPEAVDFRGCSVGTTPAAMTQIAGAVGAKSVIAGDCFAVISISRSVIIDGNSIQDPSEITLKERDETYNNKRRVLFNNKLQENADSFGDHKKCIVNRGVKGYFAAQGHFVAVWFNHANDGAWIPGQSVCYSDVATETVDPNKALAESLRCRRIKVEPKRTKP